MLKCGGPVVAVLCIFGAASCCVPESKLDLEITIDAYPPADAHPPVTKSAPYRDPEPEEPPQDHLAPREIQLGMRAVKDQTAECREGSDTPRMVQLSVTIMPDGSVSTATALGTHSGTPLGACVAAAVRKARFRAFAGPAMTITYPIIVR